jgi:hypothetical protein
MAQLPLVKAQLALAGSQIKLIGGFSCNTMFNKELWTSRLPLYSMNPNLRNLFMEKAYTRSRCAEHLRERFLTDLSHDRLRRNLIPQAPPCRGRS